jgi:hypothetical protein
MISCRPQYLPKIVLIYIMCILLSEEGTNNWGEEGTKKTPVTNVMNCSLCYCTASSTVPPSLGPLGFLTASTPKPWDCWTIINQMATQTILFNFYLARYDPLRPKMIKSSFATATWQEGKQGNSRMYIKYYRKRLNTQKRQGVTSYRYNWRLETTAAITNSVVLLKTDKDTNSPYLIYFEACSRMTGHYGKNIVSPSQF